jgi:predicted permease
VAVLSHGFWSRRFGAEPRTIGRTVALNGRAFRVVGVAPRGFHGANALVTPDVWVPLMMYREVFQLAPQVEQRRARIFPAVGRLKAGVRLEQAQAELQTVARQLERAYPAENEGRGVRLLPLAEAVIPPAARGTFVAAGAVLAAVAALVLLIACANVAGLLLVRASGRRKEIAVRLSLGARRLHIVRQLLTESVLLGLAGGGLGLALAHWCRDLLWAARPPMLASAHLTAAIDGRVLGFTLLLALTTGVLFGLAPALQTVRTDLVMELKERAGPSSAGPRRLGLRNLLVVGQIALSVVALVGATLFLRSLQHARQIQPGFETDRLLSIFFNLGTHGYSEARGREFQRRAAERVRAIPGVQSAALAANRPFVIMLARDVILEGKETGARRQGPLVLLNSVEPEYFGTAGIPLVEGRGFSERDGPDRPRAAIVNEVMAARYWPGSSPVGRRFRWSDDARPIEVVGVARKANYLALGEEPRPLVYLSLRQSYSAAAALHVRVAGDPALMAATVRREVQALDPSVWLTTETAPQILARSLWAPRLAAWLLGIFGFLAVLLAALGIYGLISYSVNHRVREIGVRMALGARPRDVLRQLLREGMRLAAWGVGLGLLAAAAVSRAVSGLLFGISSRDPVTFAAVPLLLAGVALLACYVPARRATRVDPLTALRHE